MNQLSPDDKNDIVVASVCFGALGLYSAYNAIRRTMIGDNPTTTVRRAWLTETMASPADSLLVVQTMRNLIIAATLMVTGVAQILGRLISTLMVPGNPEADGPLIKDRTKLMVVLTFLFLSLVTLCISVRLAVNLVRAVM